MKNLSFLGSLLVAVLIASCNQGSDTSLNGGSSGMWTIPGVGTEYVFQNLQRSTNAFDTTTILKTGQHLGGKTNVISYADNFGGQSDTGFYNIESNGDFSFGVSVTNSFGTSTWKTLPTGSRQTMEIESPVDSIGPDNEHIVRSDVRIFVGIENITVPAGQFSTLHVRENQIDDQIFPNDTAGLPSGTDTVNSDLWFAPSAGIYVKVINDEVFNGQNDLQANIVLLKYLPK